MKTKRKKILISGGPLQVCGHNGYDLMMGLEDNFETIEGKKQDYLVNYLSIGCSKCNEEMRKKIDVMIKEHEDESQ